MQTWRIVIYENDRRQPALVCARYVRKHVRNSVLASLNTRRLGANVAVAFFSCQTNIKMRNSCMDAQAIEFLRKALFEVFPLPVVKVHIKARRKHIHSSILANFLVNFKLYDEFLRIFELLTSTGFTPMTVHSRFLMMVMVPMLMRHDKSLTKLLVTPYVRIQSH